MGESARCRKCSAPLDSAASGVMCPRCVLEAVLGNDMGSTDETCSPEVARSPHSGDPSPANPPPIASEVRPSSGIDEAILKFAEARGFMNPGLVSQARAALIRAAAFGHRVPLEGMLAALALVSDDALRALMDSFRASVLSCENCETQVPGKVLLTARSISCPYCQREMVTANLKERVDPTVAGPRQPAADDRGAVWKGGRAPTIVRPAAPRPVVTSLAELLFPEPGRARASDSNMRLVGESFGNCRLIEVLGAGGWGAVYLAEEGSLGTRVAVKVLQEGLSGNEEHLERFMAEARITSSLVHPAIRKTLDAGQERGRHFMVMEYIEGASLQELVHKNGPLDSSVAVAVLRVLVEALRYALDQGIIHRDVKPSNVLVSRTGEVKLTDFGLAKNFQRSTILTATGAVLGTPQYMSPEQFKGARVDQRSDIYSLGSTLFFLLTGRPPFEAQDFAALGQLHQSEPPPSPLRFNPSIPAALCAVLARMLEKRPELRPSDYRQLAELLAGLEKPGDRASSELPILMPLPDGVAEGWMDEDRMRRCVEIQETYQKSDLIPPPLWHVMMALGYAQHPGIRGDLRDPQRVQLKCDGCGAGVDFDASVLRGEFACPKCRVGRLRRKGILIRRHRCFVMFRLEHEKAADPAVLRDLIRLAARVSLGGNSNVILDMSSCTAFPEGAVGDLMTLREQLTVESIAPIVLLSPRALKVAKTRGLHEFFLVIEAPDMLERTIDGAGFCPHARLFACAARGLLPDMPGGLAWGMRRSTASCPEKSRFDEFYTRLASAIESKNVDSARASLPALLAAFAPGTCFHEAAVRAGRISEERIQRGLEQLALSCRSGGRTTEAQGVAEQIARDFPSPEVAKSLLPPNSPPGIP